MDFDKRTCLRWYWELTGLPCEHAISSIFYKSGTVEDYMDDCYSISMYEKCYAPMIHPINGENLWSRVDYDIILPPIKL